jgi:hypothetical protein
MGYHHPRQANPYQQGNVQGETPSSLDSSNSNAVQGANLRTLAIITRGLHVHTRSSQLFKLATIQR